MNKLQSIIRYICQNYPYKGELSKARLTKMVYLADWRSAQLQSRPITSIQWVFNHYGPYVEDVIEAASTDPFLRVIQTTNHYGTPKVLVQVSDDAPPAALSDYDQQVLDEVIDETSPMAFKAFIDHVYSTYPIRTADRYDFLNLPALAHEEINEQPRMPF
ncbi:hypothetical protein ALFP_1760 [Alcaligenes faecalis]|uniref:Panacea domain-containing protein n=1 Tax=Alcaligenes faecalis TaxID=511 RepID=UPI0007C577D2|nr:Panacea domain-containing protein [Alcaligenes faecalis]ARP53647.1 hypothetical protein ALFP_1760 [Alcaligenes faecalis]